MKHFLPFGPEQVAVLSITRSGIAQAGRVVAALPGARLFAPEKFQAEAEAAAPGAVTIFPGKTAELIPMLFTQFEGIIALMALGIVVRLIAPYLQDKAHDPGIVVLDEGGRFAIPVLSGHVGGANALAMLLAERIGATPVLTTASDSLATLAVDLLGREWGWRIEAPKDNITRASAAVVNNEPVAVVQEVGTQHWWTRPTPPPANLQSFTALEQIDPAAFAAVLWISRRAVPEPSAMLATKLVIYRPPEETA